MRIVLGYSNIAPIIERLFEIIPNRNANSAAAAAAAAAHVFTQEQYVNALWLATVQVFFRDRLPQERPVVLW